MAGPAINNRPTRLPSSDPGLLNAFVTTVRFVRFPLYVQPQGMTSETIVHNKVDTVHVPTQSHGFFWTRLIFYSTLVKK